ncbi:MAG TPA: SRPBCC domain-containing protein [bacterium]|jgi:uncharacterized protein YndB with AHSA1/START domain|nr:SRPBCC domain-containing protein [bacterium]
MEQGTQDPLSNEARAIRVSRLVAAPQALVWKVLTESKHVNAWWGPQGFKNADMEMDFRVGGVWSFNMIAPDGTVFPNRSVFKEIRPPARLVFEHGDKDTVYFVATWTLEPQGDKTLVTIVNLFPSKEIRDRIAEKYHAVEGAEQTLAKLEDYAAKL